MQKVQQPLPLHASPHRPNQPSNRGYVPTRARKRKKTVPSHPPQASTWRASLGMDKALGHCGGRLRSSLSLDLALRELCSFGSSRALLGSGLESLFVVCASTKRAPAKLQSPVHSHMRAAKIRSGPQATCLLVVYH